MTSRDSERELLASGARELKLALSAVQRERLLSLIDELESANANSTSRQSATAPACCANMCSTA